MKYSICADIMYQGAAFEDKLRNLKALGYTDIEFWGWANKHVDNIRDIVRQEGLNVVCCCLDSRDAAVMAKLGAHTLNAGDTQALIAMTYESIAVAKELGCKALITTVGDALPDVPRDVQLQNVVQSLKAIAPIFEENGMTLLVEPINLSERASYLLPNAKDVAKVVEQTGSANVKLLYDIYHQAMEQDFDIDEMLTLLPLIGHIHIADVPGRHEPGTGTVDYKTALRKIDESGYTGFAGAEFVPSVGEEKALGLLKAL